MTPSPRRALVGMVRRVFNDQARGEQPVVRSADALFAPDTVAWRVHGDVTTMMVGGVAALLLQMLHPSALAGVWDHSNFRTDMLGRLRRTARFIAVTTFGARAEAEAVIAHVRRVHDHVLGVLEDGTPYSANDPRLLAWVHVTESISFLDAWIAYAEPDMPMADQHSYFAEVAQIARALGADPVPVNRTEAEALIQSFRSELVADQRTRDVAHMVLTQPAPMRAAAPAQRLVMQAAVDLLPDWARAMHGRQSTPLVGAATWGVAATLRWAFAGQRELDVQPAAIT